MSRKERDAATGYEIPTERRTPGAVILLFSLVFKFLNNFKKITTSGSILNAPFNILHNTHYNTPA
jgi:hypothetical protein